MYRNVITLIILVSLFAFLFQSSEAYGANKVGCIISIKGSVQLNRNNNYYTAYSMLTLYEGDYLVVYNKSQVVVAFYNDGHMQALISTSAFSKDYFMAQVTGNTLVTVCGKGTIAAVNQYGSISVPGTSEVSQIMGGYVGRELSSEEKEITDESKSGLQKARADNPEDDIRHFKNMGTLFFRLQQYGEALDYYKKALKIDPEDKELNEIVPILEKKVKEK